MKDNQVVALLNAPSSALWVSSPFGGEENNRRGFTLIELLVVVLIIAILAAVAIPQYKMAVLKSRYSTLKTMTKALSDANEAYYLTNGQYTTDKNNLDVSTPATGFSCHTNTSLNDCIYSFGNNEWIAYEIGTLHATYTVKGKSVASKHICKAKTDSTLANKLCQQETGKSKRDSGDSNWSRYVYN